MILIEIIICYLNVYDILVDGLDFTNRNVFTNYNETKMENLNWFTDSYKCLKLKLVVLGYPTCTCNWNNTPIVITKIKQNNNETCK